MPLFRNKQNQGFTLPFHRLLCFRMSATGLSKVMRSRNGQWHERAGFTLIELLVVISIIGMLASVVMVALNSARKKARDAKRIAEVAQIMKASEFYYAQYNRYPGWASCPSDPYAAWLAFSNCRGTGDWDQDVNDIAVLLKTAGILQKMPKDPLNQGGPGQSVNYTYMVETWPDEPGATTYVCTNLEVTTPPANGIAYSGYNYCLKAGDMNAH